VQEEVRRRLAGQVGVGADVAVDDHFEAVEEACGVQHLAGIARGTHDRQLEVGVGQPVEQGDRSGVGDDAVALEHLVETQVLACPQPGDGLGGRRVVGFALGKLDASRVQEAAHPVGAWFAVDEVDIVGVGEGPLVAPPGKKLIKHFGPGVKVNDGGRGDDTVEIKENRVERRPIHHGSVAHRRRTIAL
jgi:hypothetical protein